MDRGIIDREFMYRAYVVASSVYEHTHTINSKTADFQLESVSIDDAGNETTWQTRNFASLGRINSISVAMSPTAVVAGLEVSFDIELDFSIEDKSGVTYCVVWDYQPNLDVVCDEEMMETNAKHRFNQIQSYTVFVRASNEISSVNQTINVPVMGKVMNFTLFNADNISNRTTHAEDLGIRPIMLIEGEPRDNKSVEIFANARGAGAYTFRGIIDGDTSNYSIALSQHFVMYFSRRYVEPTAIQVYFEIGDKSTRSIGYVQERIDQLVFVGETFVRTNTPKVFNLTGIQNGTNVTYQWKFEFLNKTASFQLPAINNGCVVLNNPKCKHNFENWGYYEFRVYAWNFVNVRRIKASLAVYDDIKGLAFDPEYNRKTFYPAPTQFKFYLTQGTGLRIWVDYGDGTSSTYVENVAIIGDQFVGIANHSHARGVYDVTVHVENANMKQNITHQIAVENKIEGFNLTCKEDNPLDGFIEEFERINITASIIDGSNVDFFLDFGNGYNITNTTLDLRFVDLVSYNMSYEWNPEPYLIQAWVWNNVSNETANCSLPVSIPTLPLENLTLWATNASSLRPVKIYHQVNGTRYKCSFTSVPILTLDKDFAEWTIEEKEKENAFITFLYRNDTEVPMPYTEATFPAGIHNVTATCNNRLNEVSDWLIIESYVDVTMFEVELKYKCMVIDPKTGLEAMAEEWKKGEGDDNNIFPSDCVIDAKPKPESQSGSNYTYTYNFDAERPSNLTVGMSANNTYVLTDSTREAYIISVNVWNPVSNITMEIPIQVYQRVAGLTVNINSPGMMDIEHKFIVETEIDGNVSY
jgi:hypothetical protein